MSKTTDLAPEPEVQPAAKEAPVVVVPAAVFQQIVERLALQPYKEVGALVNVLMTYKSQMARVE